jgi:LPS-assembly lipoprotein
MPKPATTFRLACLLALLALLAGCGFHLRNAIEIPAELGGFRVVAPDPYSPLAESLATAMERAGAQAQTDATQPATTLQIVSERWGNTPISIDELGRAQEFSLRYAVVFTLVDQAGAVLVPRQAVELSRDYVATPNDAVGATSEQELLAREMRRDMGTAILRRIGAALNVTRPGERDAAPGTASPADASGAADAATTPQP